MEPKVVAPERACLLIVDISGYTTYLQGVELEHAQDVIADLMTAVVEPVRSHFRVNKLEGDAVFLYSPAENIDGSTFLDLIESSYFAFKGRVRSIARATTCNCGACSLIPHLDMKMVAHHGTVGHQIMLGMDELVGSDVVAVHRLLKNDVPEATGISAYALLTAALIGATALEPDLLDMPSYQTDLDDIGSMEGWVHDLDKAWKREQARRRVYISPQDSLLTIEQQIPGATPTIVWEWMTRPELRGQFEVDIDKIVEATLGGRRGVGAETHCVHGENAIKEKVIDWRPPHYVTYTGTFFNGEPFVLTDEVVADEEGVTVRKNFQPGSSEHRGAVEQVLGEVEPMVSNWLVLLAGLVREQIANQPDVPEPEIPSPNEEKRLATSI